MQRKTKIFTLTALALAALLVACGTAPATPGGAAPSRPVTVVPDLDLPRYMGDWYVIANIPTWVEKGATRAKESYRLEPDGSVSITFTFNADDPAGPLKRYTSTGFPEQGRPAIWGVQFVWPIKADYRVSYLSADYQHVIVTREKRDYVWIMARTPTVSEADYQRLVARVAEEGYDPAKLQRVPQGGAS